MNVPKSVEIEVRFEHPAASTTPSWIYEYPLPIKGYTEEHCYDLAILELPNNVSCGPSLELTDRLPVVGEPICALGYPFEDPHLTIHQGIISAVFGSGPATMLKLDMSVNPSNSGGPLISMVDGKVVGVIARKATGPSQAFDHLMDSFEQNTAVLKAVPGGVEFFGINPLKVLALTQQQMKQVSNEIARSANVGIGYAIWVDPLRHEVALDPD